MVALDKGDNAFASGILGTVSTFDFDRGVGEIVDDEGRRFALHCTQIADGSRSIEEGTRVTFSVLRKLGRYEAAAVEPV